MGSKIARLVALFAVISVAGILFVGFRYVGAGALVGLGPSTVRVQLRDPGGIFPAASVSYRGVELGKVGEMRVIPGGLEIELDLDHTAPEVPANAVAVIANRSAVGEQYVDLQPTADAPPYLQDGDVIPFSRTRTPVPVDSLLKNLNALATSVPLPELRQTVDELYNAFNRTGPQLQRLIDASNPLVRDAIANLPQTTQLLRDGRVVLDTQNALAPQILSSSRDLAVFTDQLKRDDPNLRRLVNAAPPAAMQLQGLIQDIGPDLGRTLSNLLVVTRIAGPRLDGIEQVLVTYPALSAAAPSVVPGDGFVHFGLVLNINDPPACRAGYDSTFQRADFNLENARALDTGRRCNEGPPINVRGSQNNPNRGLPGDPSAGGGGSSPAPTGSSGSAQAQNQRASTSMDTVPENGIFADQASKPPIVIPGLS